LKNYAFITKVFAKVFELLFVIIIAYTYSYVVSGQAAAVIYYSILISDQEDPNVQISSYASIWVQGSAFKDSKR
jgi:hypothetical protein